MKTKAIEWARRHFGRKLTPRILTDFDRKVSQIFSVPKSTPTSGKPSKILGTATPVQIQRVDLIGSSSPRPPSPTPGTSYSKVASKSPPASRQTSPKSPPRTKITKFPALGDKKHSVEQLREHWAIPKITQDTLMIGSSNFSRIPWVPRDDVQILSYPGLKLQSLWHLIRDFKFGPGSSDPGRKPSKILFSCGLNDRCLSKNSYEGLLRKIVSSAKTNFPGSTIYFAQIGFSQDLPPYQQENLRFFNRKMQDVATRTGAKCVPYIPLSQFEVGPDSIHWTENCARTHLDHFLRHLN